MGQTRKLVGVMSVAGPLIKTGSGGVSSVNGVLPDETGDVHLDIPSIEGLASEQWVLDKHYLTEHQSLDEYAKKDELPTKVSELENDLGFLTEHQSLEGYAKESWVEEQGYLTEHQDISNLATKDELSEVENKIPSLDGYATEQWVEDNTFSGDYNDLLNKPTIPTIPTNISAFNNDVGYLTEHQSLDGYATEQWVADQHYLTEHQDISGKQDKLTAGDNITISEDNVISSIGGGSSLPDYPTTNGNYSLIVTINGEKQTLTWNPIAGVWELPTKILNDLRLHQAVTINKINNTLEVY